MRIDDEPPATLPERCVPQPGTRDIASVARGGATCSEIHQSVTKRLAREHLTAVYGDVVGSQGGLSDQELSALGFPADIVRCFADPTDPRSFRFAPAIDGFALLPESAAHRLRHARLQIPATPAGFSLGLKVLRDLLSSLDKDVRFTVLIDPGTPREDLRALSARWGGDGKRVAFFEHASATVFAQDNGRTGVMADGTLALLLPRIDGPEGRGDRLSAEILTEHLGLPVVRSKLYWQGGNVLFDGQNCLIGANTIAVNRRRLGLGTQEVIEAFRAEFGAVVTVLGDVDEGLTTRNALRDAEPPPYALAGGQADFHLDLDVGLLGNMGDGERLLAAVADPDGGWRHLADVLDRQELFEGHFLPEPEMKDLFVSGLERTMARRRGYLASCVSTLRGLGYEVLSIPDLRLLPGDDNLGRVNFSFNYTNAIPALGHDGEPAVHLFRYGIPALDDAAMAAYATAGIHVRTIGNDIITANEALRLRGGPHCLYAKLG